MTEVPWFRLLYHELNTYKGSHAYQDVLVPWHEKAMQAMAVLNAFGTPAAMEWRFGNYLEWDALVERDVREQRYEMNWNLYALSRISDALLLPFQTNRQGEEWEGPPVSLDERTLWLVSLGMREIEMRNFHPFYHEIVEVIQSPDPDEPISLINIIWPGFMLGQMLFCRAGVTVRGGVHNIQKDVAETSPIYFTFWRNNRPCHDDSHGWGHNSQWRTEFRRDYEDAFAFYYNVDGFFALNDPALGKVRVGARTEADHWEEEGLTRTQRIELLTNRCFIVTDRSHVEFFISEETYQETKQ